MRPDRPCRACPGCAPSGAAAPFFLRRLGIDLTGDLAASLRRAQLAQASGFGTVFAGLFRQASSRGGFAGCLRRLLLTAVFNGQFRVGLGTSLTGFSAGFLRLRFLRFRFGLLYRCGDVACALVLGAALARSCAGSSTGLAAGFALEIVFFHVIVRFPRLRSAAFRIFGRSSRCNSSQSSVRHRRRDNAEAPRSRRDFNSSSTPEESGSANCARVRNRSASRASSSALPLEIRLKHGLRLKPFSKRAYPLPNEVALDGCFVKPCHRSREV